jgi:hypothetical protein
MVPVLVPKAVVLHQRVCVWVELNITLTLSGLLFIIVQCHCKKPLVVDTVIAVILLDTHRVQAKDHRGLCDLSKLTNKDSQIGSLRLRKKEG